MEDYFQEICHLELGLSKEAYQRFHTPLPTEFIVGTLIDMNATYFLFAGVAVLDYFSNVCLFWIMNSYFATV